MLHGSVKIIIATLGWLCVLLGVIGIFLPLLPTTPFLLLAAWLFAHSSERFHDWLHQHPHLGPIIAAWNSEEGLDRQVRNRILLVMWSGMLVSALIVGKVWAYILLFAIGLAVSVYILRKPVKA